MTVIDVVVAVFAFLALLGGFMYLLDWIKEVSRVARLYLRNHGRAEARAAAEDARARFAAAAKERAAVVDDSKISGEISLSSSLVDADHGRSQFRD